MILAIILRLTLTAGAGVTLEANVPPQLSLGGPITVQQRIQNRSGAEVVVLQQANAFVEVVNEDTGERFGPRQGVILPVSGRASTIPAASLPNGADSAWVRIDLLSQLSPPAGCPHPPGFLPPGRYSGQTSAAVKQASQVTEVFASFSFVVEAPHSADSEEYREWLRVSSPGTAPNERDALARVESFVRRFPNSIFVKCGTALIMERLSRIDPDLAKTRLAEFLLLSTEPPEWKGAVRLRVEAAIGQSRRESYMRGVYSGKGPQFDAFRSAVKGPPDKSQIPRLRAVLRQWPNSEITVEALHELFGLLNQFGTCCGTEASSTDEIARARAEATDIKNRVRSEYPDHPRSVDFGWTQDELTKAREKFAKPGKE